MIRNLTLGVLFCSALCALPVASLHAADEPQITILQSSPDALFADLESIFNLTSEAEKKEWGPFKEYLDLLLIGIDPKLPIRYDILTQDSGTRYRPGFGVADKAEFLKNLDLFGVKSRRRLMDYYTLTGAFVGHLRFVEDKDKKIWYAIIGEERDDIPAKGYFPLDELIQKHGLVEGKLDTKHDMLALLINETDKFGIRRSSFKKIKDEIMAGVSQKEGETAPNFELRKGLLALQIDELSRYYADSKELSIGWTTNHIEQRGKLDFTILPIEGSSLSQTITQSGTQPSYFTAITAPEDAILAGSIFFPLDEQQRKNFREVVRLLKGRLDAEVTASDKETPEQKTAFQSMLNLFEQAVDNGLKTDSLDGFVHVWPTGTEKYSAVGGIMMSDAPRMLKVLEQLKIARPGSKVELDIETVGDVAIHSVVLSEEHRASMDDFFGSHTVYIGIGPKAVWYAIGANGLDGLKAKIQLVIDTKDLQPSKKIVSLKLQSAPFVSWRSRQAAPLDDTKKSLKQLRQYLVDSIVPGEDLLTFELDQVDEGAVGQMQISIGHLRFVGKLLARFSKETLAAE